MLNNIAVRANYQSLLKCIAGIVAIFAAAQIQIPLKPVPITLHTLIVMLIALTYSPKESFSTKISYIALGAAGLPIYSGFNAGLAYLTGPVLGYYMGMLLVASIIPILKTKYAVPNLYNCIFAQFLIYIPGVLWLSTFIGIENAIYSGFAVYIPSGIVKILLLVGTLRFLKK